ncbi:MAG: glycerol kinase GlpK [Chloroflexota bacterium]
MSDYVLAVDQGTTGTRAILVDHAGVVRGHAYREITQHYPQPGWVEHDPLEIWDKTLAVVREAKQQAGADDRALVAIGIANQRETCLLIDRVTGNPLTPAVVWQCRRTADRCRELGRQGYGEMVRQKTGLSLDAYFSGSKLEWLLLNTDGARQKARAGDLLAATMDTWLIWKLSNHTAHVTDMTNASRTMLFDINQLDWDDDLLELFGVNRRVLPEVRPSQGIFAYTSSGVPIAGVAGDQQAALFGQACFEPGMVKTTYGTGAFVLMNTGEAAVDSRHGLLRTLTCGTQERPEYALEGSIFAAGAAVQWLRDVGVLEDVGRSEGVAGRVPSTDGVYMVPAFAGLGAPYWDMAARGALVGLTRGTGKAHIVRAALESIGYQVADVVDAMVADSTVQPVDMRADGGGSANNLLMQFQADILGMDVTRPHMLEATALGAAYLAGLAVGFWASREEVMGLAAGGRTFSPAITEGRRSTLRQGWIKAVDRARGWGAGNSS